jgi:acyl-CoA thioesterase-1
MCGGPATIDKPNKDIYAPGEIIVPVSDHPFPMAAPTPATDSRRLIVCFGDSLTAGYGVDPGLSYPADMQKDLDAKGYKYRVVNMGVSGDTTKDGLARMDRVIALKPDIVVVEFGGNDGLRGLPLGDTQKNLDAIVAALKKSGTRVAIAGITLPPDYGPDYVGRFNGMYPAIAKKYGVALLPYIYKDVYGLKGYIQDDGIHATAIGNRQVAKNIEGLITPMLKK